MAGTTQAATEEAVLPVMDARALAAIVELADMLRQLGAASSGRPIDVAPFLDGLTTVSARIHRIKPLDAADRQLAARHYYAGVLSGACGDESAVALGVAERLARLAGGASRASMRRFAVLVRIGRLHGRAFAAHCERRTRP